MPKKWIKPKTCATLGIIGALAGVLAGALMAAGLSQAAFARMAAFIFYGVMILFLAVWEKGPEKRGLRLRLFLLFVALLISWFDLPLLCPALEALVLPLFALLYRGEGIQSRFFALVALEVVYLAIRTIAIMPVFGGHTLQVMGIALIAVSVARFATLVFLRTQFANEE